jgi:hypothetical protein
VSVLRVVLFACQRPLTTRCNGLAMKPGGMDNLLAASH